MNRPSFLLTSALVLLAAVTGCRGTNPATTASTNWYRPSPGITWQWQLSGPINTAYRVELYDVDLFDVPTETITALHRSGRKVICYFSAGSYEAWRSDAKQFPASIRGKQMDGWDEQWLDIRSERLKAIMLARLDRARDKGCDGVEPDNVDGYTNETGFALTGEDQLHYNRFLADAAHERGLAIGLKNDLDQIPRLVASFDFAVNEQCHEYNECDQNAPFIQADKPVLNVEYAQRYVDNTDQSREALCQQARREHLSTLVLPLALDDAFRYACNP